jgi:putative hydrolase of the HAD superfamily
MTFTTLFFDLDDTLYPHENGLWEAIRARMGLFMAENLRMPPDQIPTLRREYYLKYGTTLRGLQIHYQVDADDYLNFVHDLPLEEYIKPNPELRVLLMDLPQDRYIFTNANVEHAKRVIKILDVEDCFDGIIDVRALNFACKPELIAYHLALTISGNPPPEMCVMIDDSPINLEPACQLGFTTILIRKDGKSDPAAQFVISSLLDLRKVMPRLWECQVPNPRG